MAVAGSRRLLDLLWAALAAAGILLLAPLNVLGEVDLDPAGVALAPGRCFWAAYILLSARTGACSPAGRGSSSRCASAPSCSRRSGSPAGDSRCSIQTAPRGLRVAMLSSAIPYSLELEALRKLPARAFGVLMSLEPAVAALVGFVVLGRGWERARSQPSSWSLWPPQAPHGSGEARLE